MMNEAYYFKDLCTPFTFGKYKGELLCVVLEAKPDYIYWCVNNIQDLFFSKNAIDEILRFFPKFIITHTFYSHIDFSSRVNTILEDFETIKELLHIGHNRNANRTDAIIVQFINDFKTSVVAIDDTLISEQQEKIKKLINSIKSNLEYGTTQIGNTLNEKPYNEETDEYKADKAELVQLISSTLHSYFPTIEYSTVLSYINNNVIDGNVDIVANASRLLSNLNSVYEDMIKSRRINTDNKYVKVGSIYSVARELSSFIKIL